MQKLSKKIEEVLNPHFDELTLFVISFTCILFIVFNFDFSDLSFNSSSSPDHPIGVIIVLLFLAGMILCLYHAFTDRPKTYIEKKLMVFFAVIITAFSGIWCGAYMIQGRYWFLLIFPLWNIFYGMALLGGLRVNVINEQNISDENVKINEVVISAVIVFSLFLICNYVFKLIGVETFAICLAYSTALNRPSQTLLIKVFN